MTTVRLVLRPPTLDDLPAWHAIYLDAEAVWYGAPRSTLDENRAKLDRQIAHFDEHGFGMCAVELAGETIGAAGLQHLEGFPPGMLNDAPSAGDRKYEVNPYVKAS